MNWNYINKIELNERVKLSADASLLGQQDDL